MDRILDMFRTAINVWGGLIGAKILDKIIQNNMDLVKERGEHAVVTLMGIAMKEVRGKASGKMVNDLLRKKVSDL